MIHIKHVRVHRYLVLYIYYNISEQSVYLYNILITQQVFQILHLNSNLVVK